MERGEEPACWEVEIGWVRHEHQAVRLHAALGYVPQDDERETMGSTIQEAHQRGLDRFRTTSGTKPGGPSPSWTTQTSAPVEQGSPETSLNSRDIPSRNLRVRTGGVRVPVGWKRARP